MLCAAMAARRRRDVDRVAILNTGAVLTKVTMCRAGRLEWSVAEIANDIAFIVLIERADIDQESAAGEKTETLEIADQLPAGLQLGRTIKGTPRDLSG